jgi:hypothetical protein
MSDASLMPHIIEAGHDGRLTVKWVPSTEPAVIIKKHPAIAAAEGALDFFKEKLNAIQLQNRSR